MIVIGCDPGTEQSALVMLSVSGRVVDHRLMPNLGVLSWLQEMREVAGPTPPTVLVIEKIESFGMAVGASTFETVFWSGRFAQMWYPRRYERLGRRDVKVHLCHSARATDSNIRQALLDRFGGQEKGIGKKATPGPLYGLKGHTWAAFAVALTFHDQHAGQPEQIRPGITPEF